MTRDTSSLIEIMQRKLHDSIMRKRERCIEEAVAAQLGIPTHEVQYLVDLRGRLSIILQNDGSERVAFDCEWLFDFLPIQYRMDDGIKLQAIQQIRMPIPSPSDAQSQTQ